MENGQAIMMLTPNKAGCKIDRFPFAFPHAGERQQAEGHKKGARLPERLFTLTNK